MFTKLFEPIRIGNMELRNRIEFAPMTFDWANEDGTASERQAQHYATRAKGGAALIRAESAAITPAGKTGPGNLLLDKDDYIPSLRIIPEAVHKYGAKISLQLVHCGKQGMSFITGEQLVAPSAFPYKGCEMPRELSIPEIKQLIEDFSDAARRARDAGFDAVEFHGGHGFLLTQFLSPYSNKRDDEYGGDVLRRVKFAEDVVKRTKEKCGKDFPVIFRMNGEDYYVAGGITLDESTIQACVLERAGVDSFDISGGNTEYPVMVWQPTCWPRSCFLQLADAIKRVVHVPVSTVGNINDPALAESILQDGKADIIAIGRALVADPEMPNKAKEGKLDDIRPCIRCMECGGSMWGSELGGACSVNGRFGHESEKEFDLVPAEKARKVVVVGGGPAGMEAARVASLRGHRVALYEQADTLGGQLQIAKVPPYKEQINKLLQYLIGQVTKLDIEVHLGQALTASEIKKLEPDVVIIATGSTPIVPDTPGIDLENVFTAEGVLRGAEVPGERVIMVGGGRVGCEIGELLASKGKNVTIVKRREQILEDLNPKQREDLLNRLNMWGVDIQVHVHIKEITPNGIIADIDGKRTEMKADSIVIAAGYTPNTVLFEQMEGESYETYTIGDCANTHRILEASLAGYKAGVSI